MIAVASKSMYDHFCWEIGVYGTVGIIVYVVSGHLHGNRSCLSTSVYEKPIKGELMPITQFCIIKIFYIAVMISDAHYRVISDIFRNRVTK